MLLLFAFYQCNYIILYETISGQDSLTVLVSQVSYVILFTTSRAVARLLAVGGKEGAIENIF